MTHKWHTLLIVFLSVFFFFLSNAAATEEDKKKAKEYMQAAMYQRGIEANTGELLPFNFIAVENQEPYCAAAYRLLDRSLGAGEIRFRIVIKRYAEILETDPEFKNGYSRFIEPKDVPDWEIEKAFKDGDSDGIGI